MPENIDNSEQQEHSDQFQDTVICSSRTLSQMETMDNAVFEIIESVSTNSKMLSDNKKILSEVGSFQKDFMQPVSDIQVNKLILNNIDFPTDYAKIKQVKTELIVRYNSIIESYYIIKKKELEIELLDEEIANESHHIKKKLKILDNEKVTLQLMAEESKLDVILTELRIYYKYYKKYSSQFENFENMNDKQKEDLEVELWNKKALNNPIVFEERYGEFLKEILGEVKYRKYLDRRRSSVGTFARELVDDI